jgi:hypothetical protein
VNIDLPVGREIPCFPANTLVSTPKGLREIGTITVGTEVYAFDTATRSVVVRRVTQVLRNKTTSLIDITVAGTRIATTRRHPFWESRLQKWVSGCDLEEGMLLQRRDGTAVAVTDASFRRTPEHTTYNLTVEGCHNYFVGEMEVLVHNEGENNWLVYLGYAPWDTEFEYPIYVGKTNDLDETLDRHHRDAARDPETYGFKKGMRIRPIEGQENLPEDVALYNEAYIYHQYTDPKNPIGNLQNPQEPMTKDTMGEMYSRHCDGG